MNTLEFIEFFLHTLYLYTFIFINLFNDPNQSGITFFCKGYCTLQFRPYSIKTNIDGNHNTTTKRLNELAEKLANQIKNGSTQWNDLANR